MPATAHRRELRAPATRNGIPVRRAAEVLALLLAPFIAFFLLRIRLMPWPDLNDPAMHTTYLLDPQDIFNRYNDVFAPTARMREGARVGFLVPGRIFDLAFGPFGGFVAFRYVLVLLSTALPYLLLRRLRGAAAGALVVALVLTSPVAITAWGRDFPDSAAFSYLIAGIACLAMPARHRTRWLVAAAVLFTLAVWALATSVPLVIAATAVYLVVRVVRVRRQLPRDVAALVLVPAAVTLLLMPLSGVLLGQFNYIGPTIASLQYLSQPAQIAIWHSANWQWAPFVTYLLVPPVVAAAWCLTSLGRGTALSREAIVIGWTCTAQIAVCAWLQFAGSVQILEIYYFSSLLWASVLLTLALVLSDITQPLLAHARLRSLVPVIPVLVALLYEVAPSVPAFGWSGGGALTAVGLLLIIAAVRYRRVPRGTVAHAVSGGAATVVIAGLLVLTAAPIPAHGPPPNTALDPSPPFATALGAASDPAIDLYRVTTQIPSFVGRATYRGEQLMMWWPRPAQQATLVEPIGIYHAWVNSLPSSIGVLTADDQRDLEQRHPAQLLFLSLTDETTFHEALAQLAPYQPSLVRTGVLRSGSFALHVWLVDLGRYMGQPGPSCVPC